MVSVFSLPDSFFLKENDMHGGEVTIHSSESFQIVINTIDTFYDLILVFKNLAMHTSNNNIIYVYVLVYIALDR